MFPEFIEQFTQKVDGNIDKHDVIVFTISTCQWCKKCKKYLKEKNIQYRYIDIDLLDLEHKGKILKFLREKFQPSRIAYPFLICDGDFVVGYNSEKYKELMK